MVDLSALQVDELAMLLAAVAWSLLVFASLAFFVASRDALLKRRLWPWLNLSAAAAFVALALWAAGPSIELAPLLLIGIVGLAAFAYRSAQFCSRCGSTVLNANPFMRARFCPKCAARLRGESG
jgi:uncharacterized membrane protein YcfT